MDYTTNPLNPNVFFSIGQPILVILIVFSVIAGLLTAIGKSAKLVGLEVAAGRWFERFTLITVYAGIFWLGFSMLISYLGSSVMDTLNGVFLISGAVISIVYRATSDQPRANRAIFITLVFLGAVILWTFIFGSVFNSLPATFRDSVADTFRPTFFKDLFQYWHWIN